MVKFTRKELFTLFISISIWGSILYAAPFIETSEGLGFYGYLEVDATTYTRLTDGGFNVKNLRSRWFVDNEHRYELGGISSCTGYTSNTGNYNSSNHSGWNAGKIAYVGVQYRNCDDNWVTTNYNERDFMLIDVGTSYTGSFATEIVDNPSGTQNMIGTTTISAGSNSLTLDRFFIQSIGTAEETNDIPNDGIKICYENITGSEVYDGNEACSLIYGNYNSNPTNNGIFGHDDINIPIPSNGLRIYIVVRDLADGFTNGRTAQFQIINDGISFEQARNGSFRQLRMNTTTTSPASAALLPVELADFDAKVNTEQVELTWQTASELNNSHFEIEHSNNSKTWKTIRKVDGAGTTNEVQNYTYTDKTPLQGINYYRLKQVDYDGAYEYSPIVSVDMGKNETISVYPNPVRDDVVFEFKTEVQKGAVIAIYSVNGQLVRQIPIKEKTSKIELSLNDLVEGVYFIQMTTEKTQLTQRFVKK